MLPCLTKYSHPYGRPFNVVLPSQGCVIYVRCLGELADMYNYRISQLCCVCKFPAIASTVAYLVLSVLFFGAPLQVFYAVIKTITVNVAAFHFIRARAGECMQYNSVHKPSVSLTVYGKSDQRVMSARPSAQPRFHHVRPPAVSGAPTAPDMPIATCPVAVKVWNWTKRNNVGRIAFRHGRTPYKCDGVREPVRATIPSGSCIITTSPQMSKV